MKSEQILEVIEQLRKLYLKSISNGWIKNAREIKREIEYFEKKLKNE